MYVHNDLHFLHRSVFIKTFLLPKGTLWPLGANTMNFIKERIGEQRGLGAEFTTGGHGSHFKGMLSTFLKSSSLSPQARASILLFNFMVA
jgi:hypothetical protein